MDSARLLAELEAAAARLGLAVRTEALLGAARSGACRVRGRAVVLLDAGASPIERATALGEALAGLDLDAVYLAPRARAFVERCRATARGARRSSEAPPAPTPIRGPLRPKPGVRTCRRGTR